MHIHQLGQVKYFLTLTYVRHQAGQRLPDGPLAARRETRRLGPGPFLQLQDFRRPFAGRNTLLHEVSSSVVFIIQRAPPNRRWSADRYQVLPRVLLRWWSRNEDCTWGLLSLTVTYIMVANYVIFFTLCMVLWFFLAFNWITFIFTYSIWKFVDKWRNAKKAQGSALMEHLVPLSISHSALFPQIVAAISLITWRATNLFVRHVSSFLGRNVNCRCPMLWFSLAVRSPAKLELETRSSLEKHWAS